MTCRDRVHTYVEIGFCAAKYVTSSLTDLLNFGNNAVNHTPHSEAPRGSSLIAPIAEQLNKSYAG